MALFGRGVLREGGGSVVGSYGSDQATFAWSLAWWPHAIENGLHPLLTDRVYAPDGWNLAWTSSIPGPSLLAWPLTAVFGPVAAYDVLALAAPALAAWCAYLLCREIGTGTPAALAGGLVFGFTSYEAAETLNHLNLALVFTLPLAGYLVARYLQGGLSDRRFVAYFALCVLGVFATFLETLFWATLGGALALLAGHRLHAGARARAAVPLPRAVQRRVRDRAGRGVAVPVGRAGAPRSSRDQRPRLRARPREPARADARDRAAATAAARPREAARRQQPDRAARIRRPGAARARRLRALGAPARAARPRARARDRRRDRVCARVAARRGRAPHVVRAAVDARRRPAAGEPRAARARIRARVAGARGARRALPRARRPRPLDRVRAGGAHAGAEPGRQPLGDTARSPGALRAGIAGGRSSIRTRT